MKKIAITGQMGSGKSFITKEFSKLGVPTLIMDEVAKLVQTTYPELIQKLESRFPEGYPNGALDKMRWRNFTHGTENKHLKDVNFEELPDHELLFLFERLIRRINLQM